MLPQRPLGSTGPAVSVMSLGSWRTFERIAADEGLAVMRAAREAGVTLLDDARYDDETGTAPIPTGWSEVVFGELFRAAGWERDAVTVCNKLWWEHWPEEDATTELDGSLGRMGLDHVDVIYAIAAPTAPPVDVVVEQVAGLIGSGRARAWGTGMWSGRRLAEALDVCDATGAPYPIAAQMSCSLADHRQSDDPEVRAALDRGGIGLVAAYALAGGTLTGKYSSGSTGRAAADTSPAAARGKEVGARLVALAAEWDVPPVHLAFAYALDHPNLATVLFGATSADQVRANVAAVATYESLDAAQRAAVAALA
jgi:aryl-alcohol dehydrogenase-like predicted oxidoreductase